MQAINELNNKRKTTINAALFLFVFLLILGSIYYAYTALNMMAENAKPNTPNTAKNETDSHTTGPTIKALLESGPDDNQRKILRPEQEEELMLENQHDVLQNEDIKFASCLDEPITIANGTQRHPIDPKYEDIEFLGQLFTAKNCELNRVNELWAVSDGIYGLGSYIWLKDNPSHELVDVLQDIGYSCATEEVANECKEWELLDRVEVDEMMRLEPFYKAFKQDDCRYCG